MSKNIQFVIIGPGAIGLYFSYLLKSRGASVLIFDKPERNYKKRYVPIRLINKGTKTVKVPIYPLGMFPNMENLRDSIVLVCVKAHSLEKIKPYLHFGARAFLFPQNGTGFEDEFEDFLKEKFVRAVLTYGVTLLTTWTVKEGGIGELILSRKNQEIGGILEQFSINIQYTQEIQLWVYKKLAINSVVNPFSVLFRVKNGELSKIFEKTNLLKPILNEFERFFSKKGIPLSASEIEKEVFSVLEKTKENYSSTLQDILRGKKTEIDFLNGYFFRESRRLNVDMPLNDFLYEIVKMIEELRARDIKFRT